MTSMRGSSVSRAGLGTPKLPPLPQQTESSAPVHLQVSIKVEQLGVSRFGAWAPDWGKGVHVLIQLSVSMIHG